MVFSVSPSVTIREVDATATIPPVSASKGAFAGVFNWGPVNERVLITSEANLVNRFGKPTDKNAESFFVAADFLAYSNALFTVRVDNGAEIADSQEQKYSAKYPGSLGNSIMVSDVTGPEAFRKTIFEQGEISGEILFGSNQVEFTASPDLSIKEGDILRLGNSIIGYQDLVVSNVDTIDNSATQTTYSITFASPYSLVAENFSELKCERLWGQYRSVSRAPTDKEFHVVVIDVDGKITGEAGTVVEVFEGLSDDPEARGSSGETIYYEEILNNRSNWIKPGVNSVTADTDNATYSRLTGGTDGGGENEENGVTFGQIARGYDLFANAEEVDPAFIIQGRPVGGASGSGLANYITMNICEKRKDCIAHISPTKEATVLPANPNDKLEAIKTWANTLQRSSYWFADTGYKYRYDKYNDKYRWIPMNGDTAGLAARIDYWLSPAGYRRGVIKNVAKLAYNPPKEHRDELYGLDINSVVTEPGRGTVLFGDKTGLGVQTSAFSRYNVRRLFIVVEQAVAAASKDILFELNNPAVRARFKNMVEPFLRDIQGKGGITEFLVVSDETVNTPDVIDSNRFRGNIFIKPARSINYIELTFVAVNTGVMFEEVENI